MTALIDDLLDVSRVTRGLAKLERAPLDLAQVVADAVEQVTPLVEARRHRLVLRLPDRPAIVDADRKRLVQVLTNLLNNAVKYTPEGGQLGLEVAADDESEVRLVVTDNGIGMAPDLVGRAFDLFAQAERSADRASGGLGLGLALVKSLVELHGGTVSCDSAEPGQGSRFVVTLPRLRDREAADRQTAAGASAAYGSALRILVVDDNEDAAGTLAMLLEVSGHKVLVEHAPGQALARAREAAPQVCLLDIGLPGMDGAELARRLRAQPETAHALLVAVTGYGQDSDRARAREAGFDHHLVKPVDLDRLQALLDAYAASTATGMRIR
jgi:CheY-like chemotaxis protein